MSRHSEHSHHLWMSVQFHVTRTSRRTYWTGGCVGVKASHDAVVVHLAGITATPVRPGFIRVTIVTELSRLQKPVSF